MKRAVMFLIEAVGTKIVRVEQGEFVEAVQVEHWITVTGWFASTEELRERAFVKFMHRLWAWHQVQRVEVLAVVLRADKRKCQTVSLRGRPLRKVESEAGAVGFGRDLRLVNSR